MMRSWDKESTIGCCAERDLYSSKYTHTKRRGSRPGNSGKEEGITQGHGTHPSTSLCPGNCLIKPKSRVKDQGHLGWRQRRRKIQRYVELSEGMLSAEVDSTLLTQQEETLIFRDHSLKSLPTIDTYPSKTGRVVIRPSLSPFRVKETLMY